MEKRRALGRGLQALIPDIEVQTQDTVASLLPKETQEAVVYLNLSEIKPGKYQPRTAFNEEKLQELVASIKEKGVVQPVLVRPAGQGYELIAGERRFRAVKEIGLDKIPAIVREVDDANAMELALIENIQREDLNAIEEARAYERLVKEFSFAYEDIARAVGKSSSSISNILRLLNLPPKIQQFVLDDIISMGHARALLAIADARAQMKACEKIIKKGLSVREAEQLARPHSKNIRVMSTRAMDPYARSVEEELQRILGTRVRIHHGKKRGRIVVEYLSLQDLDRILGILKK